MIPFTEKQTPLRGLIDIVTGCYPRFLFGGEVSHCLPAFHFHDVTTHELEPYLLYLAENGYHTVTSEAINDYVINGVNPGERRVALCFDDAWTSLWTVVAPLLSKYGFNAIAYVIPGRVADAASARPQSPTTSGSPFATWPELRALQKSGIIDLQAHTYSHAMVFCSDAPLTFVTPDYQSPILSRPLLNTSEDLRFVTPNDLGCPLYPQRSRMSDCLRYVENQQAWQGCVELVKQEGGITFFTSPGWREKLLSIIRQHPGRYETVDERRSAIFRELALARLTLNDKLGTNSVRQVCFPWAVAGKIAESLLPEAGYETAFADRLLGLRAVSSANRSHPYRLMRLKHEYIYCLPGQSRATFFSARKTIKSGQQPSNTKTKVCLLTDSFYPIVGGGESHALLLGRQLLKDRAKIFVLTRRRLPTSPRYEVKDGLPIRRVAPTGFPRYGKYLMIIPALIYLIRHRAEYNLIYVCGLRVMGIPGMLAAILLNKSCILRSEACGEMTGGFIWDSPHAQHKRTKKILHTLLGWRNRLYLRAQAFVSISKVIHDEYLGTGVPPERIYDITNGIDTDTFTPVDSHHRELLRTKLGLPVSARIFAYSGKLNRGKGLELLLRVWKQLVDRWPSPIHLLLIGSGGNQFLSCEAELRNFVTKNQLNSSVTFTGYVETVHEYLQCSDYFAFPSESESLGLALIEALACGLPALASRIGGIVDIIENDHNGRLIDAKDEAAWLEQMLYCLEQPAAVQPWGEAGRKTVLDTFSISHIAREHMRLFDSLIKS